MLRNALTKKKKVTFAYACIKGRILNEMTKDKTYAARTVCPEEEYWEMAADPYSDLSFEAEFLRTYGQSLTEKETKWLIKSCFTGLSVTEIAESENVSVLPSSNGGQALEKN